MKKQYLFLLLCISMSIFPQNIINEKLIPFHDKQGKWGYIDADSDKIVIATKFDFVNLFESGIALIGINNPNATTLDNKYLKGYIRENGDEILPVNFIGIYDVKTRTDSIFRDLKNITFANGTNGIVKLPEGKWLVEPGKYKDFQFYKSDRFLADNIDFFDSDKKYSAPKGCKIKYIDSKNRFFEITKGETEPNEGICTWEGKIIIEPKYIDVQYISKTKTFLASTILGKATLKNIESRIIDNFLFDENGKQIVTFKSTKIPFIREDEVFASFEFNNKELYIDLKTGASIKEPVTENGQKIIVSQDSKTGLFGLNDKQGNEIIKPIYTELSAIDDYTLIATKIVDGKNITGVIEKNGKQLIPFIYQSLNYSYRRLIGQKDTKWGLLDFYGEEEITPFIYNYSFDFNHGFANVFKDSGEGIIDFFGKVIVQPIYNSISRIEIPYQTLMANLEYRNDINTYFAAKKDNKYGLYDDVGQLKIPFEYGYIRASNDIKQLEKGWMITEDLQRDKQGLINVYKNITIPPIYDGIEIFDNFLISNKRAENNYTYQLLSPDGKPISDIIYDEMKLNYDYFIVSKNKQEGIMNQKGEIIIPLKFNYIWAESPSLIRVEDNERYYYINVKTGKEYKIKE